MKTYNCEHCNIEFETFQAKANHVRWNHKDNTEYILNAKNSAKLANEKVHGKWIEETVECSNPNCGNITDIKYRENKKKDKYFCSRSCANSRGPRSSEFKKIVSVKVSKAIKEKWKNGEYKLENNKRFSSKREREILKYFKTNHKEDIWTSGGRIIHNSIPIVRDMYSDKLKICFEYDGIWHFKDIYGQLEHKQKVDEALESWCTVHKYRLIRVDENSFESMKQIKELIYKRIEPIIKVGKRY
jgi:hypothetical protein